MQQRSGSTSNAEMELAFDLKNPDSVLRWKPNAAYKYDSGTMT